METITCNNTADVNFPIPSRVSHKKKTDATIVNVNGIGIGGSEIVVIAGPCAVESREQLFETARSVRDGGASILRGGAFKPRSSPYSFQGLGEEGLKLLAYVRTETGLPVVTEVMDTRQVELVSSYADMLQVGSRNMQNFPLLKEVGMSRKPVLLKRGMMATIEEFLLAAEYILNQGNDQVILCERGIRTFETSTRNTLDLSAVPMLKRLSHLPVIVDPSHGTGLRWMVPSMAKAAVACGADGLIMEVHYNPEAALCDGHQSLSLEEFDFLMSDLEKIAVALGRKITAPKPSII
jgi:3-deoxy-7-phosphoheptulonate synthase